MAEQHPDYNFEVASIVYSHGLTVVSGTSIFVLARLVELNYDSDPDIVSLSLSPRLKEKLNQ